MADLTSNQLCNICCIHYNAGLRCCALGSLVEGGYLFAKQGGLAWIVACSSREVYRTWNDRNDAVTVAQASNACGDWFVPSRTDLILGYDCRSYWDGYSITSYWSSTNSEITYSWRVCFNYGSIIFTNTAYPNYVRAFRRVAY